MAQEDRLWGELSNQGMSTLSTWSKVRRKKNITEKRNRISPQTDLNCFIILLIKKKNLYIDIE